MMPPGGIPSPMDPVDDFVTAPGIIFRSKKRPLQESGSVRGVVDGEQPSSAPPAHAARVHFGNVRVSQKPEDAIDLGSEDTYGVGSARFSSRGQSVQGRPP